MRLLAQLLIATAGVGAMFLGAAMTHAESAPASIFRGAVFIDSAGAPVGTQVEGLVGSTVCAQTQTVPSAVDTGTGSIYTLALPAAANKSGCGTEGAKVTFRVNGRVANQSAEWHASQQPDTTKLPYPDLVPNYPTLDLVVGPPVFLLAGYVKGANPPPGSTIRALVGSITCGTGEILPNEPQGDAWYRIVVKSDAGLKGCAKAGDVITLQVNGTPVPQGIVADANTRQVDISLPLRSPEQTDPSVDPSAKSSPWILPTGAIAALVLLSVVAFLFRSTRRT
jgi:hypothetical protein